MYDIDKYIAEKPEEKKGFNARIDLSLAQSQAVLMLMKLQQSRLLTRFLEDVIIECDENMKGYDLLQKHFTHSLYGYESDRFLSFSNKVIFIFRKVFEPSSWFYNVGEKLPTPIPFTINPNRSGQDLFTDDTVGKILFKALAKNYKTYNLFAQEYNLPYANVKNMFSKFKYTQKGVTVVRYKTFVTESVVRNLRDTIHPDYWYIFPEELSSTDKNYRFVKDWMGLQQAQEELNNSNPYAKH